jgi:integrase
MVVVHVFTRHRKGCPRHADAQWKKCTCPKFLHWCVGGKLKRVSAKTTRWEDACRVARRIEDGLQEDVIKNVAAHSVTVKDAVVAHLSDKRAQRLKPDTLKKLELIFERQLLPWCEANSVSTMLDLDLTRLREWRATWRDAALSAKKKQERVTGFFHFCQSSGWIKDNPAKRLSRIRVEQLPTSYFTPSEFQQLLAATHKIRNGTRLRALTLLMRWSGLSIRDAVTLERSRLSNKDQLSLYRAKTGVPVYVTLPPDVAGVLLRLPSENPRYFFWSGNGNPKSAVADWQRSFRRLFKAANLRHEDGTPKRCFPHMLRDTFAVECLLAGVPMHEVAMLLGHTSIRTTEKHYAPFVAARMARLDDFVKGTWNGRLLEI